MGYKNFKLNIILRCAALVVSIFILCYLIIKTELFFTIGLISFLIIVIITSLIQYLQQTNRVLKNFLESIRYSDFTRTFESHGEGSSYQSLMNSFNEVIKEFKSIKAEKERHYFYLHTVLQHMEVSMIAYQANGNIEWINDASKDLFGIDKINNIKELDHFSAELVELLSNIKKEDKKLLKVNHNNNLLQLSIYGTSFKVEGREVLLVSLKNIQYELEENEIESWQKLIRVLTHEIMNSITPISSLSETIHKTLDNFSQTKCELLDQEDKETIDDIGMALETIRKRSVGLLHFVDTYRNLTKIPKPNFTVFKVSTLINNITNLFKNEMKEKSILLITHVDPIDIEVSADEQLIEQVLVNIVKNSIHALENCDNACLKITASTNKKGRLSIVVNDNGVGILPDVLERIFIPFFTTKPKGSGIGLSLSKQILRLHGGTINAVSTPHESTSFTLVL